MNRETFPWLSLLLAGLAAALYAVAGPAPESWIYDRAAVADGDWWRLLTAHWVHSDTGHLGWNLGALLILAAIVETNDRRLLGIGLLGGTLAVDLMLWLGLPDMAYYCGLSGVLNALLLPALLVLRREAPAAVFGLIAALSLLKILIEGSTGEAVFTHTAWASVPMAHLAGWLLGLGVALVGLMRQGLQNTQPD